MRWSGGGVVIQCWCAISVWKYSDWLLLPLVLLKLSLLLLKLPLLLLKLPLLLMLPWYSSVLLGTSEGNKEDVKVLISCRLDS